MSYEYDNEVDGLYIWFANNIDEVKENYANEIWPEELKSEIGLLFDKNGKLFGMEVMPASKYFDKEYLDRIENGNL